MRLLGCLATVLCISGGAVPHSLANEIQLDTESDAAGTLHLLQTRADRLLTARSLIAERSGQGSQTRWPFWPTKKELPAKSSTWSYSVRRHVKILLWTDWLFMTGTSLEDLPECEFSTPEWDVGVVRDPNYDISDQDVILFHLSNLVYNYPDNFIMPAHKREGQIWVAMCGEPLLRPDTGIDCHLANDTEFMSQMDIFSSFSMNSDLPAIQDPLIESMLREPIPNFAERGSEVATMAYSDCSGSTREAWTKSMFDAFEKAGRPDAILSYGQCSHNAEEPTCHNICPDRPDAECARWLNRCASRAFKLVAENINEDWYVTEKVWDALGEGTIPVYWGPPQVKDWVPPGSIIYALDYESSDELVDKILNFSDKDFKAAYAWKEKPVSEWGGFEKAWEFSHYTILPRICEEASKRIEAHEAHEQK